MKTIPFKCRFGHISIVKFPDNAEKPSTVACGKCLELNGIERVTFPESFGRFSLIEYLGRISKKFVIVEAKRI